LNVLKWFLSYVKVKGTFHCIILKHYGNVTFQCSLGVLKQVKERVKRTLLEHQTERFQKKTNEDV